MSKEEGGGGGGGEPQAQYVGPYRLEKTLGKGQTGEWSFIEEGQICFCIWMRGSVCFLATAEVMIMELAGMEELWALREDRLL